MISADGAPETGLPRLLYQVNPEKTRFAAYAEAMGAGAGKRGSDLPQHLALTALEAICPCVEIVRVHRDLTPVVPVEQLRPRLERLLAGPALEIDESAAEGTTDARTQGALRPHLDAVLRVGSNRLLDKPSRRALEARIARGVTRQGSHVVSCGV